ncbi:hypothetical protein LTR94_032340, partial [Friedmanniomyces endolithicus]
SSAACAPPPSSAPASWPCSACAISVSWPWRWPSCCPMCRPGSCRKAWPASPASASS